MTYNKLIFLFLISLMLCKCGSTEGLDFYISGADFNDNDTSYYQNNYQCNNKKHKKNIKHLKNKINTLIK